MTVFSAVINGIESWRLVLDGKKTQTRRLISGVDLGLYADGSPFATDSPYFDYHQTVQVVMKESGRVRWEVGKDHAVQAKRGGATIWWTDSVMFGKVYAHEHKLIMGELALDAYKRNFPKVADREAAMLRDGWHRGAYRVTAIRREDVRKIGYDDCFAEGATGFVNYWRIWAGMHDKVIAKYIDHVLEVYSTDPVAAFISVHSAMRDRPAELYDPWVITYEVVK